MTITGTNFVVRRDGDVWRDGSDECGGYEQHDDHGHDTGACGRSGDRVVTNPDTQSGNLASGFTFTSAPAPTVSSVSPTSGPAVGGTGVTITGANFVSGATVTFGGTAATSVVVTNSTTITATTPAHAAGAVTVVVTNPGYADRESGEWLYVRGRTDRE